MFQWQKNHPKDDLSQCNVPCFVSILALTENRFSGPGSGDAGTIYRIVAYVWIVLGLAYVALIINYISNVLVRKAEKMERMSKAKIEVCTVIKSH